MAFYTKQELDNIDAFFDCLEEQGSKWEREARLAELVSDKFQSGNDIEVERITLTRAEVCAISNKIIK